MELVYQNAAEVDEAGSPVCPVCSAARSLEWGFRTGHTIFECQNCGVVFFDRATFELHDYQTYYEYTDAWDEKRVEWELKIRRRALTRQLAQIGGYVSGRKLLDVGAGAGLLCRVASNNGWDAEGLEVSDKARRIGEQFLQVAYVEIANIEDESLDVITCHHVLEHMEEPNKFICELRAKLKPSGIIAVHVPHREPLSFLIRNKLNTFKPGDEKLCALYVPEHISGFTPKSLVNTFELFGFRPLFVRTSAMWGTYYDPFFLKNYLSAGDYVGIIKHTIRSLVDNLGVAFAKGDWVVGYFRKAYPKVSTQE